MGFKEFIGTTKGKAIAGGAGAAVAVGIVVAVLLQGEGYRSIAVDDVRGSVDVVGETNNGQAYKGERLYSGDDVDVKKASELTSFRFWVVTVTEAPKISPRRSNSSILRMRLS